MVLTARVLPPSFAGRPIGSHRGDRRASRRRRQSQNASAIGRALRDMATALGHGELTLLGLGSANTAGQLFDGLAETQESFSQNGGGTVVCLGRSLEGAHRIGGMTFNITKGHDSSPSVGAPSGAGAGTSHPTDGDRQAEGRG